MTPLTLQEQAVKDILLEERLAFESHHVFELPPSSAQRGLSVDFLIFLGHGMVLECTYCKRKRGSALSELRRRSAFMDYRFGLLKGILPKLVCGAFIEAPNESKERLATLSFILSSADFVASSIEDLQGELDRFRLSARG